MNGISEENKNKETAQYKGSVLKRLVSCPTCGQQIKQEKKCPKCGSKKVIMFSADDDFCQDCNVIIAGS